MIGYNPIYEYAALPERRASWGGRRSLAAASKVPRGRPPGRLSGPRRRQSRR